MLYIGVDLGGTKIEAAALSDDGAVLARERTATPDNYDAALQTIRQLTTSVEGAARNALPALGLNPGIGVGAPGSVSPKAGIVRNANAVWLNGRAFREDLQTLLGRPVAVSNDANCLALSEALDGAAAGAASVAAIILGTGYGGGLVINGKLVEGANGLAGEIGHVGLPWPNEDEVPGPACWCGRHGCAETFVSGTGFARDFKTRTGRNLTAREIIAAAQAGDEDAEQAFDRLLSRLGRALAGLVNTYDPEVFVLGGGLSNVTSLYERLPAYVAPYVFSDAWAARFVPARFGDSSGVRGAAYLWRETGAADAPQPIAPSLTLTALSADGSLSV
ncbi:ROK family protein [Caulobacter segnis]|uniref:ROK family protein n=1 Tax=Caulobacter segnis TaxID=88688 RepID=UPI00240F3599|nr:ROK family protein [Caulobacter segnis]MDG2520672.1 ROK family protein [Caulobacter segnis]